MSETIDSREAARQACDNLIKLGEISVQFAAVERVTLYAHGRYENDAEHSFNLALSATELAATHYPDLDVGLVSQFAAVHDLPEVYAGDVPSYRLSDEDRVAKEEAEAVALARLLAELPPYSAQLLRRYEAQKEPEARFVRLVDKILPAVIHAVAPEANRIPFFELYGIESEDDLREGSREHGEAIRKIIPEFELMHMVRALVSQLSQQGLLQKTG